MNILLYFIELVYILFIVYNYKFIIILIYQIENDNISNIRSNKGNYVNYITPSLFYIITDNIIINNLLFIIIIYKHYN